MIFLARLVPTNLVSEKRTGGIPITSGTGLIQLANRPFLRIHDP